MSITWFENLVGKENVSDEIVDREVYSTDASQIKGKCDKVVWATEVKHLHQIVLYAKRNKLDLIPRGAGTNLVGSCVPDNSVVIDFSKMNKIIALTSNYVVVEPGVILDDLNSVLRDKFFPIQPEDSSTCTIGGMIGINSSGFYEKKYGRMKDWVLEVEMIDGNGRLKTYDSKVVGKEGILGLITNIKLKITDKIDERSMNVFKYDKLNDVLSKVNELKSNQEVIAIEFINLDAAKLAGLEERYYLIVEYHGFEGGVRDLNEMGRLWHIRKKIFHKLASNSYVYLEDPLIPQENLAEFLYYLETKNIPCYGPIGINVLYPCFSNREEIKELYDTILRLRGVIGSRQGIGLLKKNYLNEVMKEELRNLKEQMDPMHIMNKGKVI
ncbi:FAD-binding oxidoreductase [Candidatus Woesearchaeota archaeon]|nr:FAD-binding oxidoreductase [Candidatus Woesearchaeota archaeon]